MVCEKCQDFNFKERFNYSGYDIDQCRENNSYLKIIKFQNNIILKLNWLKEINSNIKSRK